MIAVSARDAVAQTVGEGVQRKVLVHTEETMVVEVHFASNAIGSLHSHPHRQVTYIQSGVFEFESEGEKLVCNAGDSLAFEPNVEHGVVCLQKGVVLDFFTPCRKDFL